MKIQSKKIKIAALLLCTFPFSQISFAVETLAPQLQDNAPQKSASSSFPTVSDDNSTGNPSENGPLSRPTSSSNPITVTGVTHNAAKTAAKSAAAQDNSLTPASQQYNSKIVSVQQVKRGALGNYYEVTGKTMGFTTLIFLDSKLNKVYIKVTVQGPIKSSLVQQTINVDKNPPSQITIAPGQKILFKVASPGYLLTVVDAVNNTPPPVYPMRLPASSPAPPPSNPGNGGSPALPPTNPSDPGGGSPTQQHRGQICPEIIYFQNGHTYDGCWNLIS